MRIFIFLMLTLATTSAQTPTERLISPEVHADGRVTFRFAAPNAREVFVSIEGSDRRPMQKDNRGVWTITAALEPDFYGYSFVVDGTRMLDPQNPLMKPNLLNPASMVHVPGARSAPWEQSDVPRGTVHHHFYRSAVAADDRDFFVYTPPGYDARRKAPYPVLYLLHGFSDDASGWTAVGRTHVILDNLIAQKKAQEMLVVMPLGYGTMEMLAPSTAGIRDPGLRRRSFEKFRDTLLVEVMPFVEKHYRASSNRSDRAIAGLSMGGAESLFVGLNALDRFAWIGAFSSGGLDTNLDAVFPAVGPAANAQLRLLWIACGTEDRLIDANRTLREWLTTKQVRHTPVETPGGHTWMVWRRNLSAFVPLLFGTT